MSYYFILVMASSQLNTLSCRWDSCYGWGRYLRFLFDQLQTFRFWAMSQDLSWLEVFRWSNDQAEMQRHYIEYCWYSYNTSWLSVFLIFNHSISFLASNDQWSYVPLPFSKVLIFKCCSGCVDDHAKLVCHPIQVFAHLSRQGLVIIVSNLT